MKAIRRLSTHRFMARDGSVHSTWNEARKHHTFLDVVEFFESHFDGSAEFAVLEFLKQWNVSKKGAPSMPAPSPTVQREDLA